VLLMSCLKCKGQISGDDRTCSHCGVRQAPPAIRGITLLLLIALFPVLIAAVFSTNFAHNTMPRDVLMGTAVVCMTDALPNGLADVLAGVDTVDFASDCQPNWFRGFRHGMPRVDGRWIVDSLSRHPWPPGERGIENCAGSLGCH
jgi:hypothetical protein